MALVMMTGFLFFGQCQRFKKRIGGKSLRLKLTH